MALDLRGKRVTLMGLGTRGGGLGVARYLAGEGARVTVTDQRPAEALAEPLAALVGLPIRLVLGKHEERDFTPQGADLIVRNPGVPRRAPMLELARSHGLPVEMEMSLFFRACPAPIVGVTGTKGKTTVSTLTGEMLRATFPDVVVAGNMGISALVQLPSLRPDVPVVIELSSWQLESLLEHGLSPHIAVLTMIAEDHLNTYDDFADYADTKRGITRHQRPGDWLVVNRDDVEAWQAATETAATVVPFGQDDSGADGAWLTAGSLVWRRQGEERRWPATLSAALTGMHGARNALAALAAAKLAGADGEAIRHGLGAFRGVKDRMETVAEIDGVAFVNDTTATAPIAAVAALDALGARAGTVHLLAGGADKRLDPAPMADAIARDGVTVYLFEGSATPALATALRERGVEPRGPFGAMADAVAAARAEAEPGDVVLLSPGCASFGLFRDEFDRGERFCEAVGAMLGEQPAPSLLEHDEQGKHRVAGAGPHPNPSPIAMGEGHMDDGTRGYGWTSVDADQECSGAAHGQKVMTRLLPPTPARVHFVGIGGIGMSGLARILNAWGYAVSGSDAAASPLLVELEQEGIAVTVGHTATEKAAAADLVVATAAVGEVNAEIAAAHAAGRPVVKRAKLLGALADARRGVAVAGSHGKSTTTGMIVAALRALGGDPSFAIGATLGSAGTNAAPGDGPEMIVEADEYDRSFLQLHPHVAVITNVEYDHPDVFPDTEAYDAAFAAFVAGMRREGTLVIAGDDPGCARVMGRCDWVPPASVVTFGETAACDWRLEETPEGWRVTGPEAVAVPLTLAVPGRHNLRNATGALVGLVALGYDAAAAAAALEAFSGVGRRFETKGEARGVLVIDDYAHHPSEIAVNLRTARERFPGRRVWAVFQPHTYSRLKALLPEFAASLAEADRMMILDVYAAREKDDLGVSAADLVNLLPAHTLRARDPEDAARMLAGVVEAGDVVLTLGAGSVTDTGPLLLSALGESATRARHAVPVHDAPVRPRVRALEKDSIAISSFPTLKVLRDAPMRLHTTWRIGGPAEFLVRAATPEGLLAAVAWGRDQGLPITVLGGGSNLLVGDGGLRGLVVLARTPGERAADLVQVEDLGDAVRLTVAAQAPLSWTGRYAAERGWVGMDWGVGLPGTIGGATVNNAGAHGTEQIDHLEQVLVLDEQGEVVEKPAQWLEAAYRHTVIKAAPRPRPWTALAATMRLPKGDPAELVRLADEHAAFRKLTQPTGACAGSTFANPDGDFAGRLLEESGLKGFAVGGAAFSPKHANWIVNDGSATAAEVRELIAIAQERVRERFGVELHREVEYLGDG